MNRYVLVSLCLSVSGLLGVGLAVILSPDQPTRHHAPVEEWERILLQADQQCARRAYTVAIATYQKILDFAPRDESVYERAKQGMRQAAESRNMAFRSHRSQGDLAYEQLDLDAAELHYVRAVELYLQGAESPEAKDVRQKLAGVLAAKESNTLSEYNAILEKAKNEFKEKHFHAAKEAALLAARLFPLALSAKQIIRDIDCKRTELLEKLRDQIHRDLSEQRFSAAVLSSQVGLEYDPGNKEFLSLLQESEIAEGRGALAIGERLLQSKDFATALDQFRIAEKRLPGDAKVRRCVDEAECEMALSLAEQALRDGDYQLALEKTVSQLIKHPREDRLHRIREEAESALSQGEVARIASGLPHLIGVCGSPDGTTVVLLDVNGVIRTRDRAAASIVDSSYPKGTVSVQCAALSPSGSFRALVDHGNRTRWGQTTPRSKQHFIAIGAGPWLAVAWSADDQRIAVLSRTGTLVVIDAIGSSIVYEHTIGATDTEVRCIALNIDGRIAAVGFANGSIRLVEDRSGHAVVKPLTQGDQSRGGAVTCVRFSPDSATLASGTSTGIVRCWSIGEKRENHAFTRKLHSAALRDMCFSTDGQWFASSADDATAVVWRLGARNPVKRINRQFNAITALAFCSARNELITGDSTGIVKIWKLEDN